jgi:hypothetical protein
MITSRLKSIARGLRSLGPYLLVELLLPGGTLIALLLWLSQHGYIGRAHGAMQIAERYHAAKVLAQPALR